MTFHYKVGEEKYYNKLPAILENIKSNNPVQFNTPYNNDDFSQEPQQSLDDLIKEELNFLRENYKIIKLYYSGGTDSHLLLENFIKHNIFIDEIICLKSGFEPADFEIKNFAEPNLYKLKDNLKSTKISIKSLIIEDYIEYYSQGITQNKIDTGAVGVHNYLRIHFPKDFYSKTYIKDTLHIRAMDKPKIIAHDNKWYAYLLDGDLEPHINNHQFFSRNLKIQIKQCHLFLQVYKNLNLQKETDIFKHQDVWNSSIGRGLSKIKFPEKKLFFSYPNNKINYKGKNLFYQNNKDKLAIKYCIEQHPKLIDLWIQNLEQLKKLTNNQWWNNGCPELGMIGVFSKFYCLSDNHTKTVDELFPDGFKG